MPPRFTCRSADRSTLPDIASQCPAAHGPSFAQPAPHSTQNTPAPACPTGCSTHGWCRAGSARRPPSSGSRRRPSAPRSRPRRRWRSREKDLEVEKGREIFRRSRTLLRNVLPLMGRASLGLRAILAEDLGLVAVVALLVGRKLDDAHDVAVGRRLQPEGLRCEVGSVGVRGRLRDLSTLPDIATQCPAAKKAELRSASGPSSRKIERPSASWPVMIRRTGSTMGGLPRCRYPGLVLVYGLGHWDRAS